MANEEHLAILRQGVAAWNAWREAHPDVRPDLSRANLNQADLDGADLSRAYLIRANLIEANLIAANLSRAHLSSANLSSANLNRAYFSRADLSGAHLIGANLSSANIIGADLSEASLIEANLRRANLRRTYLGRANLSEADLSGVDLGEANLSGANLSGANLSEASLDRTLFATIDLRTVAGLDTVRHRGPSMIGTDTLYMSHGTIPEIFLRGCGVPHTMIEYLPSLLGAMQPVQFYSCFISYSAKDEDFARRMHERMRVEHLRVWFAPEDMQGGREQEEQIDQAIRVYDKLLVILSPHSRQSKWVMKELRHARTAELQTNRRKLFPIRLMPVKTLDSWECIDPDTGQDIAAEVRAYHIPDFSRWKDHDAFERVFARLLRDLKATNAPPAPAPAHVATPSVSGQTTIIVLKQRRLQILEGQRALKGSNTPPEVIIEIEDLRREIAELEAG
jgi:hypothetical protein